MASAPLKVSGHSKLAGFKSDHVFIRYAGPEELTSFDRLDFGLFGRSWAHNVSWAVTFIPGARENNWRDYLPSPNSNIMGSGDSLHVIASGATIGMNVAVDGRGRHERSAHGVRTTVQFNQLETDKPVGSDGGSLVLEIGLFNVEESGNVLPDTWDFDGQVYWHLYLK